MTNLRKISLHYDRQEDRLLLGLQLAGGGCDIEKRLLLTRSLCSRLRLDIAAMRRMAAVEESSERPFPAGQVTNTAGQGDNTAAAGASPTVRRSSDGRVHKPSAGCELVTRVQSARRRSDGRWIIRLTTQDSQEPMSLVMSSQGLHELAAALEKQVTKANWGLPAIERAEHGLAQTTKPRALH